jgi:hypothetical protein
VGGRYPRLGDVVWLRQRFIVEAVSAGQIASEVGCSTATVWRALAEAGLRRDVHVGPGTYPRLRDVEWLRDRYLVQGARIRDIAAEVGCRELAVHHALVRAKIPLRGVPRVYPQLGDENWLRLRYVEQRISVGDIAEELGCDWSTVIAALAAAGIPRPRPTRGRSRRFAELGDHDWLRRRYLDEGGVAAGTRGGDRVQHPRRSQGPRRGTGHAPASRTMGQALVEHGLRRVPPSLYRVRRRGACEPRQSE